MLPNDRENMLYEHGKRCSIDKEEHFMFELLKKNHQVDRTDLLDLGCGSGEITRKLTSLGYSTVGIDFSSAAIKIASENGIDCKLADLDEGIPFADASFDIVWAGDVLEHVFDPVNVLSDVNRVLKQDGLFLSTIPNDLNIATRIKTILGISYQESVYKKFNQYKHHTFFSERLVRFMFGKNNLEVQKIYHMLKLPFIKRTIITSLPLRIFSTLMIVAARKK